MQVRKINILPCYIMEEISDTCRSFVLNDKTYIIKSNIKIHGCVKYDVLAYHKMYKYFKQIIQILDAICKDKYWLIGGTLLGIVRHKCTLPWDNDIDIAITTEAYKLISKNFDDINTKTKTNFTIIQTLIGYKIYADENSICDLFVVDYFQMTNNIVYSGPRIDDKSWFVTHYGFPNIQFDYNDIYPLVRLKCGDIYVNCPNKYKKLLVQNYNKRVFDEIKFPKYDLHHIILDSKIAHGFYWELHNLSIQLNGHKLTNLISFCIGNINMSQYNR